MSLLFIPVLHFAKRICSAWAAVFFLLFYPASGAHAEAPNGHGKYAALDDEARHARSPLSNSLDETTSHSTKLPNTAAKSLVIPQEGERGKVSLREFHDIVTVVQSEDGGSYAEFSNALHKILSSRGIAHVVIDSAKPIPDSGLIIGVGMKAATAVAASDAPSVLNVLIPKAGYEKLLRDFPRRAGSRAFSAIFLDQPVRRQVHLIAAILPDKRNVGLLYSSPPGELAQLRQELTEHGLSLHEQAVDPALPLSEALQDMLRSSEVLLALPDATVYNSSTIRNILLATYRSGVPLIGFSSGYVKAGALCAVFSTPAQIATQAAALIRQFGDTHVLPATQYPQEFEVMVNEQVARSLGLQIKGASALHDEIKAENRGEP